MEFNKIAGAVLATLLLMMVIGKVSNTVMPIYYPPHEEPGAVASAPPAKKEPQKTLPELLAAADAKVGERRASACTSCHTFEKGGPNRVGPNLWGVVGRKKGGHPGFDYSNALKGAKGDWTYADLFEWLDNPAKMYPGTKMTFHIANPAQRADVLAYLRTLSDSPVPLPKVEKKAEAPKAPEKAEKKAAAAEKKPAGETLPQLLAAANPKLGEQRARACTACHTFEKGGPNRVGPNLWGVIGRKKGSHPGFAYSSALKNAKGDWTDADLFEWLDNPAKMYPGAKMTFHMVNPKQRADILAYLHTLSDHPVPLPAVGKPAEEKKSEPPKAAPGQDAPKTTEAPKKSEAPKAPDAPSKAEDAKKPDAPTPPPKASEKPATPPAGEKPAGEKKD